MIKYSEIVKAHKTGLFEDAVFKNLLEKCLQALKIKDFTEHSRFFPTEHVTEVIIYDDGLL